MMHEHEPSSHPPRSVLETLIDEDRVSGGPERLHLEGCDVCRARVQELIEGEKTLIDLLKRERSEPVPPQERPPCVITRDALWEYADWLAHRPAEEVPESLVVREIPDEFRPVEEHIETCDRCLTALMAMQKLFARLKHA